MANIILDATKSTGVSSTVTLNAGDQIQLRGFELSQAQQVFVNESGQLVIVLTDGTQFLVTNFAQNLAENPNAVAILSENGETISYSDVIASFVNNAEEVEDIEPALGEATPTAATGAASATIGEGSNAAENFDLFGAGFGLGDVVTSEAPEFEAQAQDVEIAAQSSNPPIFVEVGPNANNASVTGNEDTTFNLNIPAPTDVDSDNATLSITVTTLPNAAAGVIQLSGTPITVGQVLTPAELTSLTFVPTADFNGDATFGYNVSDGNNSTPSVHTITVTGVDDSPVFAGPSSSTLDEDAAATDLNVTIPTDADTPYGDVLTMSITTPVANFNGTVTLDGVAVTDGQTFTTAEFARLQYTPTANYFGSFNIDYTVTDSTGNTVSNTHTVNVNSVNDAPVTVDSSSTQAEDSGATALNIPTPTDVEGDAIITIINAPFPTEGVLYYADGTTPVQASDVLTVAQLTSLTFIPAADFNGTATVNYTISDGTDSSTATHTITVTPVNDAPVATDSTSTQAEDSTDIALGITAPTDIDDAALTAVIATLPTDGVLKFANGTLVTAGVSFDAAELNGLTFSPNADFNGTVAINYTVEDAAGLTDTATHTVTVTAANDAPVVTNSTSSQDEDTTAVDLNINTPTDVDGDTLTITLDALPTNGTLYYADGTTPVPALAVLSVAELTSLKFTPNANFNGDVTINYTVNDGTTTVGGSHTVTVNSIEDVPVVTNSSSIQDEDSVDITLGINLPTDNDGDTLYAVIATLPTDGTLKFADGSAVPAGTQFLATELPGITFTPNANFLGTVAINYTVTDNNTTPVAGTHTVTVNNIPDEPVVVDSSSSQDEDSSLGALGIPTPTDPDGDALTIITTLPSNGTLYYADGTTPVANGASLTVAELTGLLFTPNANFNGTVSFTYSVSDSDPLTADVTGTHTITVNSVNDAPDVTNSSSTQAEDSVDGALNIPAPSDIDGDSLQFRFTSIPNGTLKLADGTVVVAGTLYDDSEITGLTFTPNADFNGTINLNYEVIDGTDATAGTHTITVTGVNDAPETTNSSSSQNEDTTAVDLNITAPTDPENDALTITIDALPANGTLYYANGTTPVGGSDVLTVAQLTGLKFTPNADYNGTVTINYTVNDGNLTTGGTHTITVNPVNDAPVVTNSSSTQAEDSSNIVLGIPVATDVDGDALRFSVSSLPSGGTFTFTNGSALQAGVSYAIADIANIRFTPNADFNGTVTLNYSVTDGVIASIPGSHTITVSPVNDAPVANNSTSSQDEDTSATLGIPTPTDVDGDALFVTIATLPTDGTLTFANGSAVQAGVQFSASDLSGIRFTPNLNFNGTVNIDYTVTDGSLTDTARHTITVNPVADGIITNPDDLVDTTNQIDFNSILRTAEVIDCVTTGSYRVDAEYRYDSVLAGSRYSYDLPDSTFVSSDGSPLTYSATYTYNGRTYNVPTSGGWVNIDPTSGDLDGTVPTSMAGLVTFTFTATTPEGITSSKSITYNFMSQAQYNAIDVIGPKFGNYVLPENTSDNIMVGMNEAGILRYDLLSTGRGVTADLERGYVDKNNGYVDLIDGFREFQATNYNDTITAEDGKRSYVYGNGGNDTIISSSTGDYLNGGSGSDTISYQNATSAVSLNLANGSNNKGDTLVSFENAIGSDHNDSLVGSSGANYIDGGAGRDAIYGQAGNDTIIFDANDSTLSGGSGYDKLVITDANSSYGNNIDLSKVAGGSVNVSGFEEINMDNTTYNETLHMNVADLLSSASGHEIRIKGDLIMDFQGATRDDRVQIHDKTSAQINAAERGTTTVDGTRYEVYDFGSDGRLLVEFGLDILDASGNVV
jgi:hypothetical protein